MSISVSDCTITPSTIQVNDKVFEVLAMKYKSHLPAINKRPNALPKYDANP